MDVLYSRYGGLKLLDHYLEILDARKGIQHVKDMEASMQSLNQLIEDDGEWIIENGALRRVLKRYTNLLYDFPDDKSLILPAFKGVLLLLEID